MLAVVTVFGPAATGYKGSSVASRGTRAEVFDQRVGINFGNRENRFQIVSRTHRESDGQDGPRAENGAKSYLEQAQGQAVQGSIELVGEPRIRVGALWYCAGFGIFSGAYLVSSFSEKFDAGGGYTSHMEVTSEGHAAGGEDSRAGRGDLMNVRVKPVYALDRIGPVEVTIGRAIPLVEK